MKIRLLLNGNRTPSVSIPAIHYKSRGFHIHYVFNLEIWHFVVFDNKLAIKTYVRISTGILISHHINVAQ